MARVRLDVTTTSALLGTTWRLCVDGLKCDGCGQAIPSEFARDWITLGWTSGGAGKLGEIVQPAHFCSAGCALSALGSAA